MSNYIYHNGTLMNSELYHYGVKGMKWGVRRYQNADGSLTEAGKKRVSKKYEKLAKKTTKAFGEQYSDMYLKSYNKAVDDMNNGEIDKFNEAQRKKYGEKFAKRDGYVSDYEEVFTERFNKYMNASMYEFYNNNTHINIDIPTLTKLRSRIILGQSLAFEKHRFYPGITKSWH